MQVVCVEVCVCHASSLCGVVFAEYATVLWVKL